MLSYFPPDHKQCNTCGETLPLSDFNADKQNADGLRGSCIKCIAGQTAGWRASNPERHKRNGGTWYLNNRQRKADAGTAWVAANPDKIRAIRRRYRQNHPDYDITQAVRRRSRKKAALVDPHVTVSWLRSRDGDGCYYCGAVLVFEGNVPDRAHLEHKTPLSRGGKHSESNCVLACRTCNQSKYTMTETEFLERAMTI